MKFIDKFNGWSFVHLFGSALLTGILYWWIGDYIFAAAAAWLCGLLCETVGDNWLGKKLQIAITYTERTDNNIPYGRKHIHIFDHRGGDWYDMLWNMAGIGLAGLTILIIGG